MHQVSIGVISGEDFGGWFEIGVQLLRTGKLFERQGKEGSFSPRGGMPGGYKDRGGGGDNGEGCYKCGKHGHFAR